MKYELIISDNSSDLINEQLQTVTEAACSDLKDFGAGIKTSAGPDGNKSGEVVTLGTIVLTLITSGVASTLLNKVASILDKKASLKVTLKRPDGATLELSAPQIQPREYHTTLALIKTFIQV